MRRILLVPAMMLAFQLGANSTVQAQNLPGPDQSPVFYQPGDYNSLLSRIENLEANQAANPSNARLQGGW